MCLVLPLLSTHDPAKCALTSHQKNRREYGREGLPPPFSTGLRRIFPRSAPFRPEGGRRRWYPRSDRPGGPEGGAGAVISAGCFFLGGRGMAVPKIFLCRHVDRGRMCKCGDDGRTTTFWTSLDCFARNPALIQLPVMLRAMCNARIVLCHRSDNSRSPHKVLFSVSYLYFEWRLATQPVRGLLWGLISTPTCKV